MGSEANMSLYLSTILASLITSLGLTPLARKLSLHFGIVDRPSSPRKIQSAPIPRSGGLAVFVAFIVGIAVASFHPEGRALLWRGEPPTTIGFMIATLFITLVGLVDDVRTLDSKTKFLAECGVAFVLYSS